MTKFEKQINGTVCLRARNVRRKHILNISKALALALALGLSIITMLKNSMYNPVDECNVMNVIDFYRHDVTMEHAIKQPIGPINKTVCNSYTNRLYLMLLSHGNHQIRSKSLR